MTAQIDQIDGVVYFESTFFFISLGILYVPFRMNKTVYRLLSTAAEPHICSGVNSRTVYPCHDRRAKLFVGRFPACRRPFSQCGTLP